MVQTNLIFTWKPESFNAALGQPHLVDLRTELGERRPLSGSLLIWKRVHENESWWLIDLGHEKIYHLDISSDTEVAVSEETQDPKARGYPWPNLDQQVYATAQGFVDWLMRFKSDLDEYDLGYLKRTDLSENNLSFEIVHPNLLIVYEMFQEILTSSNDQFVSLSDHSVQQEIQTDLNEFLKILSTIHYFDSLSTAARHAEVLKQTFNLCHKVQQQLQQIVTYLKAKKAEQLEIQLAEQLETKVNTTVADAEQRFNRAVDSSTEQREEAEKNESERQKVFAELENTLREEIAKETVAKYSGIFKKQTEEHQRASKGWFVATSMLIVAFGGVFYWLFETLRLGGTEWVGVFQNIFTKGFLLTLIYFVINRFSKNYTAQKHLEVVNRHRQNALDTFEAFVAAAGSNQETKDAVLLAATSAIFDANQSGYLPTKTKGSESANPIQQTVRAVLPDSAQTKFGD